MQLRKPVSKTEEGQYQRGNPRKTTSPTRNTTSRKRQGTDHPTTAAYTQHTGWPQSNKHRRFPPHHRRVRGRESTTTAETPSPATDPEPSRTSRERYSIRHPHHRCQSSHRLTFRRLRNLPRLDQPGQPLILHLTTATARPTVCTHIRPWRHPRRASSRRQPRRYST